MERGKRSALSVSSAGEADRWAKSTGETIFAGVGPHLCAAGQDGRRNDAASDQRMDAAAQWLAATDSARNTSAVSVRSNLQQGVAPH